MQSVPLFRKFGQHILGQSLFQRLRVRFGAAKCHNGGACVQARLGHLSLPCEQVNDSIAAQAVQQVRVELGWEAPGAEDGLHPSIIGHNRLLLLVQALASII